MKRVGSWWVPERETHIVPMLSGKANYQSGARDLALKHVKKFDLALDVGGHIGLWSKPLSKVFAKVHAFEPVPEHIQCFRANVDAPNVKLHTHAIGERQGKVGLSVSDICSGGSHIKTTGDEVEIKTIDGFGFETVDFIKMDIEGYEIQALNGAVETLKRCKPVLCIEQKPNINFGFPRYAASDFLKSLGMKEVGRVSDDLVFVW